MSTSTRYDDRQHTWSTRRAPGGPGSSPTRRGVPARTRRGRGLVVLLVALVLGVVAARARRRPERPRAQGATPASSVRRDRALHYPIPRGQDPAAAMSALVLHGYAADLHERGTTYEIEVRSEDGGLVDREHARGVLQRSSLDMAGKGSLDQPVRFTDE